MFRVEQTVCVKCGEGQREGMKGNARLLKRQGVAALIDWNDLAQERTAREATKEH